MQRFKINSIISKIAREKHLNQGKTKKPLWFWIILGLGVFVFIASLVVFLFLVFLIRDLPNVNDFTKLNFAQSTLILDRQGNELYSVHGEENRKVIALQEVSENLVQATLAIEDNQFFEHKGFDLKGIMRAAWTNFTNSGVRSGGSTITQQFIKNTFLTREKTYIRKLKELILAVQLENSFSKEKILEMYINSIPYGSNAYGVESASQTYFAKKAQDLSLAESVVLAALPQAPSYYSPYGQHRFSELNLVLDTDKLKKMHFENEADLLARYPNAVKRGLLGKMITLNSENSIYLRGRADFVLLRMLELGYISDEEKQKAWENLQTIEFRSAKTNIKAPHFVMYVKEELEKKYGKEVIERGGLRVYTTLNPRLQEIAEKELKKQAEWNESKYNANNAALVSIEPKTGQILAMVGSRDYWDDANDGNVNVTLSKRLPGSSFKPISYAAAFLKGYSPATVVFDLETNFGKTYQPKNYDGKYRGPVTVRYAIGNSLNIPAVKLGMLAGIESVYDLAKAMGVDFDREADWYGGALPLGVGEAKPIEMLQAYSVFANNGKKIPFSPFLRVEDAEGNILEAWSQPKGENVLDAQVAYLMTNVLSDAKSRGYGWNKYLQLNGRVNAAKTGTSNKKENEQTLPFDAWTIGFTPQIATAVWVGNNDGSVLKWNASGLMCAGPIWKNYMEEALDGIAEEKFERPKGIKWVKIAKLSGLLPTKWTPDELIVSDIFAEINMPKKYDTTLKVVEIDKVSGKLPTEFTPKGAIEKRAVMNFHALRPYDINWEKPVQEWVKKSAKDYLQKLGVKDILAVIPTEYDDVHTANSALEKPKLEILSPVAFGAVSPPKIGVVTKISSEIGIQKVEFYWDGSLYETVYKYPWRGNLQVSSALEMGSEHEIKVKVYDRVYNTETSTIQVRISGDKEPPHTEIVFPKDQASFEAGSLLVVKTFSYDTKSDIKKVEFYLDDKKVGESIKAPYDYSVILPSQTGEYRLKVVAFDNTANSASDNVILKIKEATGVQTKTLQIIMPKDNQKVKFNQAVTFQIVIPADLLKEVVSLDLIKQEKETKKMEIITTFKNLQNGKIATLWVASQKGEFDFFVRVKKLDETINLSQKVRLKVK